eukprot:gnl/TRDRNA2_/TRDRNA2_165979_c0_seq2.p1 gnl/TRDRNA2_/TRDRNA2_165979_c0~~gnl/TRDRNA2_/TRDRNA2_165979_c0_seq2.p1  ORF type:complete len:168 (+),score=8.78 gnl/TRDRNA2_/TRDRNA2_165979_c0_seq2:62-505(+)
MEPDDWHFDWCEDEMSHDRGVTLVTYPHDRWNPEWSGEFELLGPPNRLGNNDVVAKIAPLPNRAIIFDGCLMHRATNPSVGAAPIKDTILVSDSLREHLQQKLRMYRFRKIPREFDFEGFRLAQVIQMACPKLESETLGEVIAEIRI